MLNLTQQKLSPCHDKGNRQNSLTLLDSFCFHGSAFCGVLGMAKPIADWDATFITGWRVVKRIEVRWWEEKLLYCSRFLLKTLLLTPWALHGSTRKPLENSLFIFVRDSLRCQGTLLRDKRRPIGHQMCAFFYCLIHTKFLQRVVTLDSLCLLSCY